MGEYRIEELAVVARTTVRSVQSYRNKGLLAPPRRQGRIALYDDSHVERLVLIADLIDRGYSLNAIGELLAGLHEGRDISDLLGVEAAASAPVEPTLILNRHDLEALIGGDDDAIRTAVELEVLDVVDEHAEPGREQYLLRSPQLFQAGMELVAAGVPLEAVLAEGVRVKADVDRIAQRFVQLIFDHLVEDGAVSSAVDADSLTDLVARLRPLAEQVVDGYMAITIDHHTRAALAEQLDQLLATD